MLRLSDDDGKHPTMIVVQSIRATFQVTQVAEHVVCMQTDDRQLRNQLQLSYA